MTRAKAKALFEVAGIEVLDIKPLIDGYSYPPEDEQYFSTLPAQVWWFVKTKWGWIEIGWRRRVISINWSDTKFRGIVTQDDVTKEQAYVHAWHELKAIEYLCALKVQLSSI